MRYIIIPILILIYLIWSYYSIKDMLGGIKYIDDSTMLWIGLHILGLVYLTLNY